MAGETPITIIGNLCDDVELRFTPSGAAVARFRVASTPRFFDKATSAFKDGEPLFLSCSAWREMAESAAESLSRGDRVIVYGNLRMRSYETREGEKRTALDVDVQEVGPSLRYATAKVQKMQRSSGNRSGGSAPAGGGFDDPWTSGAPASAGPTRGDFDSEPPF
jgi:single-strand DNA-binding protein